jgi:ribosomal RNA-processing protein 17
MRNERKQAMEEHVEAVNKILKDAQEAGTGDVGVDDGSGEEEWDGIHDEAQTAPVDLEEEYIDEDRYTTVTIESVTVDRDGLHKPEPEPEKEDGEGEGEDGEDGEKTSAGTDEASSKPRKEWPKKKKKFRYETKFERQLTERKRKAKARR